MYYTIFILQVSFMFAVAADFFSMIIIQKITIKYVATTKAFYKVMRFFTFGQKLVFKSGAIIKTQGWSS